MLNYIYILKVNILLFENIILYFNVKFNSAFKNILKKKP